MEAFNSGEVGGLPNEGNGTRRGPETEKSVGRMGGLGLMGATRDDVPSPLLLQIRLHTREGSGTAMWTVSEQVLLCQVCEMVYWGRGDVEFVG